MGSVCHVKRTHPWDTDTVRVSKQMVWGAFNLTPGYPRIGIHHNTATDP
jgi:hypothetical protein